MKKILATVLALCMVFALAACGSETPAKEEAAPAEESSTAPAEESAEAPAEESSEQEYTLGMGLVLNTDSSESGKKAQVDATVAAVVMDAEGKIVSCRLDGVQNKMDITDGMIDPAAEFKTKMELGDDYGMVAYGNSISEWDAQAKAFEEFVIGKTAAEIEALETKEQDGHMVSADETLYASCTIDITDFKAAVAKACSDQWAVPFSTDGEFTVGLAAISDASESTEAKDDEDGSVKMYSEFGAVVLGADGKILAALNDAVQPQISIDAAGEILETKFGGTKRELGENYGMVAYGNAVAEWDAQSAAFSAYVAGMSGDEVAALETKDQEGHQISADETLYASCTMDISGMKAVIAQAADYAR